MQNEGLSTHVEPELPSVAAAAEIRSLRRCLRDLAGLSALSAVWVEYDAPRLAESLADVLGTTLDLSLVFVRVHSPTSAAVFEAARSDARGKEPPGQIEELRKTLAPWLETEFATSSAAVPHPLGGGTLHIAVTRIGHSGHGVLLTGSERTDFPTESERLLLSVAANQAVIVLQQREGEAVRGQALTREQRRAQQLQRLAQASLAINAARALPDVLQEITDRAREIIGAQQGVTSVTVDDDWEGAFHAFSPAEHGSDLDARIHGPGRDWLAVPLTGRDGRNLGVVQLSHKDEGPFTGEDEAILVQLAQLASVAIENTRLYQRTQEAEDALAARLEELAVASRRKDEFLAMLAHELRNPLAPIRNAAQFLKLRAESDPVLQHTQGIIERQVTHLTRLVDDLLDVARINRGHIDLRKTELDLAEIVGEAVEAVREAVDTRGHHLSVILPLEPVPLVGDRTRLVQVIGNVLTNAAKYTPNGGRIELVAELEGSGSDPQVAIRFRDNGQGIAPDLLPSIFDLFTQAERSLDRSEGGLGIGLTLVKELVEQHGGSIEAHSSGPGQGSEFVVRLPVLGRTASRRPETRHDRMISGPSRRVLLVEDNRDAATTLQELLEVWGHEVQVAHDGPAALQVAPRFQPEVILLDIGLPQMDGYEVARRLRLHEGADPPFLVALTGYGDAEHRATAVEAGFDHHLVKPIDLEQLQLLLVDVRNASASG